MPDESCRSCGGALANYSSCSECRKVTQKICKSCNALTRKQFHTKCMKLEPILDSNKNQVIQLAQRDITSRRAFRWSHSLAIVIIGGLFVLAFCTTAYLGLSESANPIPNSSVFQNPSNFQVIKSPIFMNNIQDRLDPERSYQDCLAYGSGESLTVTCPTQYGYVYKAILDMPKDLAQKFSDAVFSIRGLGLTENLDGSVILQYQNSYYKTNFFAS